MLDIVIDNKTFTYVNSVKIDDKSYIAYTDGVNIYISEFHYDNEKIIISEIDNKTFLEVKEAISL